MISALPSCHLILLLSAVSGPQLGKITTYSPVQFSESRSSDKLFNTEGVEPTVFAYNFINAYLIPPATYKWPEIDPQKVIPIWEYHVDCNIIIYSDKSFSMQKMTDKKDFKFD
jgi:hypothetical protein